MAATSAPYGLRPINLLGGQPNSNTYRMYPIAYNYNTSMLIGDVVKFVTAGAVERFDTDLASTAAAIDALPTAVGVFMGCVYPDPTTSVPVYRDRWPGQLAADPGANKIWAYVCDDPDMLFQVQASGAVARAKQGANVSIKQIATQDATTGHSRCGIKHDSNVATATLPLRIVDFVYGPDSVPGDAYTDVIVRFNTHFHRAVDGLA